MVPRVRRGVARGLARRSSPGRSAVGAAAAPALLLCVIASLAALPARLQGRSALLTRLVEQWKAPGSAKGPIGEPWTGTTGGETPAVDCREIVMPMLIKGRIGVNIVKGERKISRVLFREAFNLGWRVGDEVVEVNGRPVADHDALRSAVQRAINAHKKKRTPIRFRIRRWSPMNSGRGMIRMSKGKGFDHVVPMLDLIKGFVQDFPVVLLMEGSLEKPGSRLSARAARLLDEQGIVFKALDCLDNSSNPGAAAAVAEMTEDAPLPSLYIGGQLLGSGRALLRLRGSEELAAALAALRPGTPAEPAAAAGWRLAAQPPGSKEAAAQAEAPADESASFADPTESPV
mmetsp:Transcript_90240/g.291792  ORF Transcript_90240/g.291792 Transcript_90240/m.291792 type:complete len:345 (-) Transcript_90240:102-1136(-)